MNWGMGLLGVVTSFASKLSAGFESLMLHQFYRLDWLKVDLYYKPADNYRVLE